MKHQWKTTCKWLIVQITPGHWLHSFGSEFLMFSSGKGNLILRPMFFLSVLSAICSPLSPHTRRMANPSLGQFTYSITSEPETCLSAAKMWRLTATVNLPIWYTCGSFINLLTRDKLHCFQALFIILILIYPVFIII